MRSTRFAVRGLAVVAALTLALAACDEDEPIPPPQITVTVAPANVTMDIGDTRQLSAAVSGTTNQSVTWSSDDQSVATVNNSGLVTGVAAGQAAIRATSAADPSAVGFASVTVNPPPAITVTVTPSTGSVPVGGTIQLAAQVAGTSNQNVTWSSQNQAVATVDQNGVVTGVSEGTAVIRATSAENASAFGSAAITVTPAIVGEIVIQRITAANTNTPVNPNNIAGQIDVTAEFTAPPGSGVTGVQVLVDDDVICSQSIGSAQMGDDAQAMATVVCSIITNAFDVLTGVPAFFNGLHTIGARLLTATGEINASADQQVTFNNADVWVLNVTTTKGPVFDNGGLSWVAGDVMLEGLPVLYNNGSAIDRVSFSVNGIIRQDTDGSDGWSFTYTSTGTGPLVGALVNGAINATITVASSVYEGGQPGPTTVGSYSVNDAAVAGTYVFRLDNELPTAGTLILPDQTATRACCSNNWVGSAYAFNNTAASTGHTDGTGVGGLEVTIFAAPASNTTANAVISNGQVVETGADLAASTVNTEYRLAKRVCDALGNCASVLMTGAGLNPGDTFGVDDKDPTFEFAVGSVGDMAIFNIATGAPATNFATQATDDVAGFAATPVVRRVYRNFSTSSGANCTVGNFAPSGNCNPTLDDFAEAVPVADGYYTFEATVRDQGGNLGADLSRSVLVDLTAPTASNISIPSTLTGGANATFTATATDALDLGHSDFRLRFGGFGGATGIEDLPFAAPTPLGTAFDAELTTSANIQGTFPFIRALEVTGAGDAIDGTGRTAASDVRVLVTDAAGNAATQTNAFAGGTVPAGDGIDNTAATNTFAVTAPNAAVNVCNSNPAAVACPPGTAKQITLTVSAVGVTGTFANPFVAVHLYYYQDINDNNAVDAGDIVRYIGAAGSATVTDDGVNRTWSWTGTFDPSVFSTTATDATAMIFAVGVDPEGDAVATAFNTNISVIAGS